MGKHVLSGIDGFEKRSDMFYVNPDSISTVDGWNDRVDFSGQPELAASIKEIGVRVPLKIRKAVDGTLELRDGERRLRAVKWLNDNGCEIRMVPVLVEKRGVSEIDSYIDSIVSNTGKPPTPTEEAASFKRLINWGLKVQEIASKTGRSVSHVRNRLELSGAIPAVRTAVEEKEIPIKTAQEIVIESDGKVEAQVEGLEKAKAAPKNRAPRQKKITKKDLTDAFYDGVLWYHIENHGPEMTPEGIERIKGVSERKYAD